MRSRAGWLTLRVFCAIRVISWMVCLLTEERSTKTHETATRSRFRNSFPDRRPSIPRQPFLLTPLVPGNRIRPVSAGASHSLKQTHSASEGRLPHDWFVQTNRRMSGPAGCSKRVTTIDSRSDLICTCLPAGYQVLPQSSTV